MAGTIELAASVTYGFERLAAEECQETFGIKASHSRTSKGRIFMTVPDDPGQFLEQVRRVDVGLLSKGL